MEMINIDIDALFMDGKMLLAGLFIASMLMTATWIVARKINNAGIVDVIWTASFFAVTLFYAVACHGDISHRVLILFLVFCWSCRLSSHLFQRVKSIFPQEDGRYAHLRKEWAEHAQRNLFIFFQIQALSVALLSLPMIVIGVSSTAQIKLTGLFALAR